MNKVYFKCNPCDGAVVNCTREPVIFSDKQHGKEVFCEPDTVSYRR